MIAANFCVTDGAWSDVRVSQAALDTFALYGEVGSVALVKRPRQLRPADSITLLALDGSDSSDPRSSRSWRV
eukprot:9559573-Alexandrium_andersonii.AAC.1